jgi:hypothetical protein
MRTESEAAILLKEMLVTAYGRKNTFGAGCEGVGQF